MRTFSKIKRFSKFTMLFSALAMVFFSLYLIPEFNVGADAATGKELKDIDPNNQLVSSADSNMVRDPQGLFAMRMEGNSAKYIYVNEIKDLDLEAEAYIDPGTGIKFVKNNEDCQLLQIGGKSCWQLDANYNWPYPSISQPETIDWRFISGIKLIADNITVRVGNKEELKFKAKILNAVDSLENKYLNASADFQTKESTMTDVNIATQLNSPRTLYVSNVKSSAVTSPSYPVDETLVKSESSCSTFGVASPCYSMKINSEWPNALMTAPFTPDWALMKEAFAKISARNNDPNALKQLTEAMEMYANSASSNPNLNKIYYISGEASDFSIYATNLSEAAQRVQKIKNKGRIKVCEPLKVDECWKMSSTEAWVDSPPSVATDEAATADFAFLTEVLQSAEAANDVKSLPQIKSLMKKYVTEAFNNWYDVKLNLTSSPKTIIIRNQDFFNVLNEETPNINTADEKYVTFSKAPDKKDQITLEIRDSYPDAKIDSIWHKSMVFLLGSVIPAWQEIGVDLAEHQKALELTLEKYMAVAERETQTTGSLTVAYPKDIIVQNTSFTGQEFVFNADIDKTLFPAPAGGYQTKVYLKPEIKSDKDIYIKLPNNALIYNTDAVSFSWKDVKEGYYVTPGNNVYTPVAADVKAYDRDFPQKYKMSIITYNADNTVKDRVDITFQTVTDEAVTGAVIDRSSNAYFNIKGPGFIRKGGNAEFTVTVKNTNVSATKPEVKKVVIYFCTGSGAAADASDGTTCQINQNGQTVDAIKVAYATKELINANPNKGWKLLEFKDNIATIKYTLDTTGSAVGEHALRVKGYKNEALKEEDAGYIDAPDPGALIAEDIKITTGEKPIAKEISEKAPTTKYGNLIKFSFGTMGETGSSLRSIPELLNRIANVIISILGIVAFLVIVIAGFMYMTAGGNAEQATKAKNAILYSLFGIVLATLSYGIMFNVVRILNSIFGSGGGGGSTAAYTFKNLLPANPTEIGLSDLMNVLKTGIRFALDLAGLVGFIMILYASLLYVLSVGDENKVTTAKKTLIWSVAGTAFLSASAFIIDYISRSLS